MRLIRKAEPTDWHRPYLRPIRGAMWPSFQAEHCMALALLMALQAAGPVLPAKGAAEFDLAKYRPARSPGEERGCAGQSVTDIVVCGRREPAPYPLEDMERRFREKPVVAEWGIAPNASIRAYGESVGVGAGLISRRAMVGVKLRF